MKTFIDYPPLFESSLHSLRLLGRGKVRDIYEVDDEHLLIITSDRLSAFDVVMDEPIAGKGRVLTAISNFWFSRMNNVIANQLTEIPAESVVAADEVNQVEGRALVVKRLMPLPIEAVVRGYVIGSGWKDYQQSGEICGIGLPTNLQQASKLAEPIFTPASKADIGDHDENITYAQAEEHCHQWLNSLALSSKPSATELLAQTASTALRLYNEARDYAASRGIIIADTKFEFGINKAGELHLIDEALTPDSSRFWSADSWREGISPPSFDKQFVRDYLESLTWDKRPPAPALPDNIRRATAEKYFEAWQRLVA